MTNGPDSPEPSPAASKINGFLERFGAEVGADLGRLDASGFVEIRCGHVPMGINVHEQHGTFQLLARVGDLPEVPTSDFYRTLLELNFLATGPCAFAIDRPRSGLYLRAMRPLEGLSYEGFHQLLHAQSAVAEQMMERLPEARWSEF